MCIILAHMINYTRKKVKMHPHLTVLVKKETSPPPGCVLYFWKSVCWEKRAQGGKMNEQSNGNRFNGAAWFDRQVASRTRAALDARGSTASTKSREYRIEYARQLALFRAERAKVKRRKAEKYAALLAKKERARQSA